MAVVTALELKHTGHSTVLGPVLCIARDLRWGRVDETFGEDPYLIGEFGAAMIEGYHENKIMACVKHYAAYSETQGGLDSSEMDGSLHKLFGFFLPPFKRAVEAGAGMFMSAFESIDGVPCVMNKWLQRDVLKGEWNYSGFIITDMNSVLFLQTRHQVADNLEEAAILAVDGGTDMVLGTEGFHAGCVSAVRKGKLSEGLINESVRRVLKAKFDLGLFEDDRYPEFEKAEIGTPEHRAVALKACRESLILLKNDGILPLNPNGIRSIALLGPNADHDRAQNGDWAGEMGGQPRNITITVRDGLKKRLPNVEIIFEKGARIDHGESANLTAAIEAAKKADVIIVVIGDRVSLTGEAKSVAKLELYGTQNELVRALVDLKKKFIINFIGGKPLCIPEDVIAAASAIVCQFIPGGLGGQAFAEAIVGDYSPGGRLTVTWPRYVGQTPVYYNQIRGSHGSYADFSESHQWPFGFGLTYSPVEYGSASLDKHTYSADDVIHVKLTVTNKGVYDVVEVVQFYVHDCVTSVTWSFCELKAFRRVQIKAGETVEVRVDIPVSSCSIVNSEGKRIVEPGDMSLFIAKNADDRIYNFPFVID
jgi:beta-glucosidase